jgi:CRISPR-associated protein Cas5h
MIQPHESVFETTDDSALLFTVSGQYAQFRRIDTTTTKQTYHVPPRTTLTGLLAAILGLERDSYYETFAPGTSAIAIGIDAPLRTRTMPILELSTVEGTHFESHTDNALISPETSIENRQQRLREYVADPSYTIAVALEDTDTYERLRTHLSEGTSVYTPALGTSECLASIDYTGEVTVTKTDAEAVESVVVDEVAAPTSRFDIERVPYQFEATSGGRKPSAFVSYIYRDDETPITLADNATAHSVGGRPMVFI